jgi:hypothetical protein
MAEDLATSLNAAADLLELAVSNPLAAAKEFRAIAKHFNEVADELEKSTDGPPISNEGCQDRVRIQVIRPTGEIQTGGVG